MAEQSAFHILEVVVVLALLLVAASLGFPAVLSATRELRVHLATQELVGTLRLARSYAIRHSTKVAVKFRTRENGSVTFGLYRDGDGDGVRNKDIDSGVDIQVQRPRALAHMGRFVGFGFPPDIEPTDPSSPGRPLGRLDDPIRFNRSDLASFGPLGTSTPGSLYVTDGRGLLSVVRVLGRTGRVRVLRYDSDERVWR